MLNSLRIFLMVIGLSFSVMPAAQAVTPDEILADPALEARARELSSQLRCVVCQSQSIDDSDAPLAKDMRVLVRERLRAGDSDAEILEFMVDRYGDYILLKPPVQSNTIILWAAPLIFLLFGGGMAWGFFAHLHKKQSANNETPSQS